MSLLIVWRMTSAVYTPQVGGFMNCFISHDSRIEVHGYGTLLTTMTTKHLRP